MPFRLAAMASTPAEAGAGATLASGTRVAERLELMVVERTTGFGLSTPLKPMFPNAGETSGACAADGAAMARTSVAAGALARAGVTSVAAEAGRANEAAMPPETTITAEALAAGFAEREMAVDRDETGFKRPWARWRPEMLFDTVDKPLQAPARSAVGFGLEITRPSRQRVDRGRPPPRRLHPKERLSTPRKWVPRSCQAEVDNLECGDRTRRTASRTPSGGVQSNYRTHRRFQCHIQVTESP